jgi:hypothetical protein
MDSSTGKLYPSIEAARENFEQLGMSAEETNVHMNDLVEITGTEKAVGSISDAVKANRRRKDKEARKSRKKNRK